MTYGSLFSGIEAASLAFEPLGWKPAWFAEIEPFPCRVLSHHWAHVPNLGDVTARNFSQWASKVDLVIGGSPCQDFSSAGKRKGLGGARGQLSLRFAELLGELQPKWFIWENVPGLLTSNNGDDFKVVIDAMVKVGYGLCWRVLDARHFGLPVSRKRLYVLGRLGEKPPSEVLFECNDGKDATGQSRMRREADSLRHEGWAVVPLALRTHARKKGRCGMTIECRDIFNCLLSTCTLDNHVWDGQGIRKLTPLEYERLQGFPDGHTDLPGATDSQRWKALGNSMAVPVIRWLGQRIASASASASASVSAVL